MFRLKLVPQETNFQFIRIRNITFVISGLLTLASIVLYLTLGLNFGIDFRGGTMVEIGTEGAADVGRIRSIVSGLGLGDVQVQTFGADNDVLIRIGQSAGGEQAQQLGVAAVKAALDRDYGSPVTYRRVELVGPKVSSDLINAGVLAVLLAVGAMLIYVWFRFEWQFGVGSVIALVHDVAMTIGLFSLLQLEFNLAIVAAILTIVGYSMNDTVVVYDRVRENLRKYKKIPLEELLNLAINETLSRTTMTAFTTFIALAALFIFGGEVIRGFTFAMIWGIFIGTYSSIFIAAPFLLLVGVKRNWSDSDAPAAKR
ncbi:MAG: protein translocase subunit SecF [Alphaproteobacteria bacterium]|nr:protein translocase subunit SecF [Alphaproteobacteria bacterium]